MSPSVENRWPRRTQVAPQLAEVVDLAVEDDHHRAVLVVDRLVAGLEVDDAQALDPEPDLGLDVQAARIGPSVLEGRAHALHGRATRPRARRA